jgi:hypothetical protein
MNILHLIAVAPNDNRCATAPAARAEFGFHNPHSGLCGGAADVVAVKSRSLLSACSVLIVGIFLTTTCTTFADGPIDPPVDDRLLREIRERDAARRIAQRDPRVTVPVVGANYRSAAENEVVNLSEIEAWEISRKSAGTAAGGKPLPEWIHTTGIVQDNNKGYVVLFNPREVYPSGALRAVSQIWVKDAPEYPMQTGTKVAWFLKMTPRVWPLQYSGSAMECKYGKPLTAEQVKAMYSAPPVKQLTIEQMAAQQSKVVTYQLNQASNGLPSFQFEIGKRYLNGDGLEANRDLALHWLRSACTNGNEQASNLLTKAEGMVAGK